jgi:hypothetical protein
VALGVDEVDVEPAEGVGVVGEEVVAVFVAGATVAGLA